MQVLYFITRKTVILLFSFIVLQSLSSLFYGISNRLLVLPLEQNIDQELVDATLISHQRNMRTGRERAYSPHGNKYNANLFSKLPLFCSCPRQFIPSSPLVLWPLHNNNIACLVLTPPATTPLCYYTC